MKWEGDEGTQQPPWERLTTDRFLSRFRRDLYLRQLVCVLVSEKSWTSLPVLETNHERNVALKGCLLAASLSTLPRVS